VLGEIAGRETLPVGQFIEADPSTAESVPADAVQVERWLIRSGNRREAPPDFRWVVAHQVEELRHPPDALVLERVEWGNAYGFLRSVYEGDRPVATGAAALAELERRLARADELRERIRALEQGRLYDINYRLERLRLDRRALELASAGAAPDPAASA